MCRKKKIKCDGKMPKCSHCINYKTDCVFTQVEKKRNPPKGYVVPAPLVMLDLPLNVYVLTISGLQCEVYRRFGK
jgi:hypothetical protein